MPITRIIKCDLENTVKSFVESGEWVILSQKFNKRNKRTVYTLGMLEDEETEENKSYFEQSCDLESINKCVHA